MAIPVESEVASIVKIRAQQQFAAGQRDSLTG